VANNFHTTSGIIGFKYLLEVLPQLGRVDVAVEMLLQKDCPSLGYMIHNKGKRRRRRRRKKRRESGGGGSSSADL